MPMPASPAESGGKGGGAGKTPGRMVGSAFAGFSELLLFHPVDTCLLYTSPSPRD